MESTTTKMVHEVKSKAELEAKLIEAGDKLVVVDFFATWCRPCENIAPVLDELASQNADKMVAIKVDVDEVEDMVDEYAIEVMPTFVFKRKGQHLDTLVGSKEASLREIISKHL